MIHGMSRDAWNEFSKTILVRYVLSYLCGTLYLDPSVSLKRIFAFSVGGLFSLSTDALTCLRSSRLKLFQSWQVETANDLPPSATRLNFGQIKFILLYLVTRLCCWLLSLKESSIYKGTSPLMRLYATQQSLNEEVWTFTWITIEKMKAITNDTSWFAAWKSSLTFCMN